MKSPPRIERYHRAFTVNSGRQLNVLEDCQAKRLQRDSSVRSSTHWNAILAARTQTGSLCDAAMGLRPSRAPNRDPCHIEQTSPCFLSCKCKAEVMNLSSFTSFSRILVFLFWSLLRQLDATFCARG